MRVIGKISYKVASIISIILCLSFVGCGKISISKSKGRAVNNSYWYVIAKIDGHDYVMGGLYGTYGTGLTHSESCPCKKGNK